MKTFLIRVKLIMVDAEDIDQAKEVYNSLKHLISHKIQEIIEMQKEGSKK